jgi:hypothetical protein
MKTMKLVLLFSVIALLFFLWICPICFPFGFISAKEETQVAIGFAYAGWYVLMLVLTLNFGNIVRRNGCWFFGG